MDKFGVVDSGRQAANATCSLDTRWVSKQRLDGSYKVRLVARVFEQPVSSDAGKWNAKPHDFARTSHDRCNSRKSSCIRRLSQFFHHSPMPSESEPVCVEPAPEAQLDSSKVWLCKKAFQGLKISLQACGVHSTQKINDMSYNQLISDPSTYVKKRTQRTDDSIFLRHMDDVVGTGPEDHLVSDVEHMQTSLYLTDVVVLRNEGDTVNNFWTLRSPRQAGASR